MSQRGVGGQDSRGRAKNADEKGNSPGVKWLSWNWRHDSLEVKFFGFRGSWPGTLGGLRFSRRIGYRHVRTLLRSSGIDHPRPAFDLQSKVEYEYEESVSW
jgi:hypothetical protein